MTANIINLNYETNINDWLKSDENVYVGRWSKKVANLQRVAKRGNPYKWGNPYKITQKQSRQEVVTLYREYILSTYNLSKSVTELRGKVLGCWCAPNPCHAEILHQLAGNRPLYQTHGTKTGMDMAAETTTKKFQLTNLGSNVTVDEIHEFLGFNATDNDYYTYQRPTSRDIWKNFKIFS